MTGSPVLPLRPLTIGELLDAAAALLRSRWRVLLAMSFALALVEQVAMTTLRMSTITEVRPKYWGDLFNDGTMLWVWITLGLTTEIFIITLLSAPATRTAVAAVKGEDPEQLGFWTLDGTRWAQATVFATILAVVGAIAAAACFLPWLVVFAIFGLSVPALIADGLSPGKSFFRSPQLLTRSGFRTAGIRLLSYFSWLLIRMAITCSAVLLIDYVDFSTVLFDYFLVMLGIGYLAVNTAGYAMMACVDAVTHIETRVRVEGLDVAVSRMRARGEPVVLSAPEAR